MDDKFIERFNLLAKRYKLSYSKLGALLGVSKDTAGNYLLGRTEISIEDAKRFAVAVGEDPAWLLTGKETGIHTEIAEPSTPYRKAKAGLNTVTNYKSQIRNLFTAIVDEFPQGSYDMWEVEGNSMVPTFLPGDKLLCRLITIDEIIDHRVYVLIVNKPELNDYRKSGIWVKRIVHRKANGYINAKSDNIDSSEFYPTFRLKDNEIREIWYPVLRISAEMSDPNRDIYSRLDELEGRIEMLESLNE